MIVATERSRRSRAPGADWCAFPGVLQDMTFLVLVAALVAAPPQDSTVSSTGVSNGQPEAVVTLNEPPIILPVSLERIRELLEQPAPVQEVLSRRPTFK